MNAAPIEILMLVDAVDHDGRPVRITLGVPCLVAEVGPLPLAGDFVLGNGDRATYFGHDRTAFLPEASLPLVSGMVRSNVPDYLRLAEVIPVPTTTADADAVPGKGREALGYARYGESDGWLPVDRTVLDEAARRMRTLFDRNVVASGGDILVKDEGRLPTGSFKARGLVMAVSMARTQPKSVTRGRAKKPAPTGWPSSWACRLAPCRGWAQRNARDCRCSCLCRVRGCRRRLYA